MQVKNLSEMKEIDKPCILMQTDQNHAKNLGPVVQN